MSHKALTWAVIAADIAFLAYYLMLSLYSRPHFDDLSFFSMLREMSIPEYVKMYYQQESGAFAAYAMNGVRFSIMSLAGGTNLYPFFMIVFGIALSLWAVKNLFGALNWKHAVPATVLCYCVYIYTNLDFAITWWLCGMPYCIYGPLMILIISLVFKKDPRTLDYVAAGLISVVLGGGNVACTCVLLATLAICAMYILYTRSNDTSPLKSDTRVRMLAFCCALILICFAIVVAAPGNYVRLNSGEFTSKARPDSLGGYIVCCAKILVTIGYFMAFNLPFYTVVALCAFALGMKSGREFKAPGRMLAAIAVLFVCECILFTMPQAFLFGDIGYQRVWSPLMFLTVCFVAAFFFIWGTMASEHSRNRAVCAVAAASVLLLMLVPCCHFITDKETVSKYASEYDARLEYLASVPKDSEDTVVLKRLEYPYTTDLKYDLYKLMGREKNPRPVLYYVPDDAPSLSAGSFGKYFGLKSKIVIE